MVGGIELLIRECSITLHGSCQCLTRRSPKTSNASHLEHGSFVCALVPFQGLCKRRFQTAHLLTTKTYLSEKFQCLNLGCKHTFQQNPNLKPRAKRNRFVVDDNWRMRMRKRAINYGRWTDGTARHDRLWAM
jgi:hypothetical protein